MMLSPPCSTRRRRPAASQTGSCSPSSAPTMPICAGSPAWAEGRTAQVCAAAGIPQFMHILNAVRPHTPRTRGQDA
eukprot:364859-Chlamydomonas_euryale.AAC.5